MWGGESGGEWGEGREISEKLWTVDIIFKLEKCTRDKLKKTFQNTINYAQEIFKVWVQRSNVQVEPKSKTKAECAKHLLTSARGRLRQGDTANQGPDPVSKAENEQTKKEYLFKIKTFHRSPKYMLYVITLKFLNKIMFVQTYFRMDYFCFCYKSDLTINNLTFKSKHELKFNWSKAYTISI